MCPTGVQCTAVQTLDWSFEFANAVLILQWDLEAARKQVLMVLLMRSAVPRSPVCFVVQAFEVGGRKDLLGSSCSAVNH